MIMKIEVLRRLLKKWQERLGLGDWEITVDLLTQEHLNGQAKTTIYAESQISKIFLLDEDDRQKSDPNDQDMEFDLIHELIHARLWSFDPKDAKGNDHTLREQAIDWITRGLIKSDRDIPLDNNI